MVKGRENWKGGGSIFEKKYVLRIVRRNNKKKGNDKHVDKTITRLKVGK